MIIITSLQTITTSLPEKTKTIDLRILCNTEGNIPVKTIMSLVQSGIKYSFINVTSDEHLWFTLGVISKESPEVYFVGPDKKFKSVTAFSEGRIKVCKTIDEAINMSSGVTPVKEKKTRTRRGKASTEDTQISFMNKPVTTTTTAPPPAKKRRKRTSTKEIVPAPEVKGSSIEELLENAKVLNSLEMGGLDKKDAIRNITKAVMDASDEISFQIRLQMMITKKLSDKVYPILKPLFKNMKELVDTEK